MNSNNNPERSREILIAIRRIIRAIDLQSRRLYAHSGVTGPQLVVLQAIERLNRPSMREVASEVTLSHPTVTSIVGRLESRSLLQRERGESDRRRVELVLTESGSRLLSSAPGLLQDEFVETFIGLEEWEQHMLISSLQRIADMLGATGLEAAPLLGTDLLTATAPSGVDGQGGDPV